MPTKDRQLKQRIKDALALGNMKEAFQLILELDRLENPKQDDDDKESECQSAKT